MALPTAWQLLIPNFNVATIIGAVLIALALFGGPFFRFIGKILSTVTGGKVKPGIISSMLIVGGVILIWGVSIFQDLFRSQEALLIIAGIIFLIAIVLILPKKEEK